jgi:ABC-type multidrug transport system fused ATPase/permease subunit
VVIQDPHLFSETVLFNITLGRPGITFADAEWAAQCAQIHQRILELPDQYHTRIAARGASLSGGERQRVAIARAVASRPRLLILDEATSHVDQDTERSIFEAIGSLPCTRIVIAHRVGALLGTDVILLMDRGKIVAQGTHMELSALSNRYCELFGLRPVTR